MNIKAVIIAACLAVATPAAAQSPGEAITPNFKHAIPNIPGKSLAALVVDYGGGIAFASMPKSAFITPRVSPSSIESAPHLPRRRELVRNARRPSCCQS